MKKILLILTLLTITLYSLAYSTLEYDRYNVSFLNMKAGLPHNFVNAVYEDSKGFLWIATYGGGLVRYDGYTFATIPSCHSNMLMHSNSCRNIVEDRFGRMWIAFDEGIAVMDLKSYRTMDGRSMGVDITGILEQTGVNVALDNRGNIWVVTDKNIYKVVFDESGNVVNVYHATFVSNTPDVAVADVDGDGTVWAAIDDGIYKLDVVRGKLSKTPVSVMKPLFGSHYVTDFMLHSGDTWVTTNCGVYRYVKDSKQLVHYASDGSEGCLSHNFATCMAICPEGRLLVGTLGGVNVFDYNDGRFTQIRSGWSDRRLSLSSDFVHDIYTSKTTVWVSTDNGGVTKLTLRQGNVRNFVHRPGDDSSLSSGCVNSTYVEPDGTLWVGTVDGGLNRCAPGSSVFTHYTTANSPLRHNTVSTLISHGRILWIGTWGGGVYWLDMDHPDQMQRLEVEGKYDHITSHIGALAYDDINNGLWIGSNDGLFFYDFSKHGLTMPFKGCDLIRGCIGSLIDDKKRLWIGCVTGMRVIYLNRRQKGQFRCDEYRYKLDNPQSRLIDKITCFCQSADGRIWVGSNGNGLYELTGEKDGRMTFRAFTVQDGLANNAIKGIAEDIYKRLWIPTNNGLSVFNPADEVFSNYSESDGMVSSEFFYNAAVVKEADVYLCNVKGLTVFDVNAISAMADNKVTFTSLQVDNQPIYASSRFLEGDDISSARKIWLREGDKSVEIAFSTLRYDKDSKDTYCYRLREFEKEWIQARAGEHSVRYTNLPPGHYTFEVKCLSAMAEGDGDVTSVEVIVSPYFYKTWWFLTLMAMLAAYIAYRTYKQRVAKLKREAGERMLMPIRDALMTAENPMELQTRIKTILDNQRNFKRSYEKSVEIDQAKELEVHHEFMDEVFKAIEEGYMDSGFDIEQLAESLHISRSTLTKRMKEETGQTVSQILREYRLNVAREILITNTGNRNITEIAYRVGFNDPKYFTRCFTKKYGISPTAYAETGISTSES